MNSEKYRKAKSRIQIRFTNEELNLIKADLNREGLFMSVNSFIKNIVLKIVSENPDLYLKLRQDEKLDHIVNPSKPVIEPKPIEKKMSNSEPEKKKIVVRVITDKKGKKSVRTEEWNKLTKKQKEYVKKTVFKSKKK